MVEKTCKKCFTKFIIKDKDLEFYNKISPVFDGKKIEIKTPDLCPDCRQQRRLAFKNERKLYKRKCDFSDKNVISIYSPDKNLKVFSGEIWWSDKWNEFDYGIHYNLNKNFFEQFSELYNKVPKINLSITNCENCEYNNILLDSKNCYMCFNNEKSEDTYYCDSSINLDNCSDVLWGANQTNTYETLDSDDIRKSQYIYFSNKINESFFCENCENCENCFCCVNLTGKKYYAFNKEYSKEKYNELLKIFKQKKLKEKKSIFNEFKKTIPKRNLQNFGNENCMGNYIYNSSNCDNSFNLINVKNGNFICDSGRISDVFDGNNLYDGEGYIYEGLDIFGSYKTFFSININNSSEIFYSIDLYNCKNCFGCSGLKNKQYCIFNKQYTKDEYNKLIPKIIEKMINNGEWGEFFPANLSPFGYNETIAQEYFPISPPLTPPPTGEGNDKKFLPPKRGKVRMGDFNWSNYESPFPKVKKIIPAEKLPEDILDIPDDILNWAVKCEVSGKPFRIIAQELEFYRKHNIPIPHKHPDVRHSERMKQRNPRKLFDRKCGKCGVDIKSTYKENRDEIVYCEECYEKEVY